MTETGVIAASGRDARPGVEELAMSWLVSCPADHALISTALFLPACVLLLAERPSATSSCVLARKKNRSPK